MSTAPGDEQHQRERGMTTEVTRELLAGADKHRSEGEEDVSHCVVGRTVPVPAAASSGIGECQGAVKGVETGMVVRLGMLGQAGQRARAQQSARRHAERVFCMPACLDEHGHRVNRDIRPP